MTETVTIDNKHYNKEDFNEQALAQLDNLRFVDSQIQNINNQQALVATAKATYSRVLADYIPEKKAAANKKNDVVTIDGNKYNYDDFSEQGKAQLANIRFADQELNRLQNQQAVMQTARAQYARVLSEEIAKLEPVKAQ